MAASVLVNVCFELRGARGGWARPERRRHRSRADEGQTTRAMQNGSVKVAAKRARQTQRNNADLLHHVWVVQQTCRFRRNRLFPTRPAIALIRHSPRHVPGLLYSWAVACPSPLGSLPAAQTSCPLIGSFLRWMIWPRPNIPLPLPLTMPTWCPILPRASTMAGCRCKEEAHQFALSSLKTVNAPHRYPPQSILPS